MHRRILIVRVVALACLTLFPCCGPPKPPKHDCPIKELVIDEASFPPGSTSRSLLSPLPRAAWASAGRTIDHPGGVANHHVYQFKTAERAAQEYRKREQTQFAEDEHEGPWTTPADLTYRSPIADQYRVACGKSWSLRLCIMVAQYEEYFVLVTSHMSEDGMTYADFQRVLRAVDEKMSACLGKPLTPEAASP